MLTHRNMQLTASRSCSSSSARLLHAVPKPGSCRHCRGSALRCAAQNEDGAFFADIKRIAKQIQGALPIVGLVSRLSAPGGGFDEMSYPEFCRAAFDGADNAVREAVVEMERRYGKLGQSRWLYVVLWMAKHGNGLVPPKNIIAAAKRLRVTQDLEIEMDRFETIRDTTLSKYRMMARPQGKLSDAVDLAVDAVSILCLGLSDGQAVKQEDEGMLADVLGWTFPDAGRDAVLTSIRGRTARVSAYS